MKEFKESYVVFLDILGFKDMIEHDAEKVMSIIDKLNDDVSTASEKPQNDSYRWKCISHVFSDSIVIHITLEQREPPTNKIMKIRQLIVAVWKLQNKLAKEGIWLRGGISSGLVYSNDYNIAGTGLIKAFDIEKMACVPRVIVDPQILYSITQELLPTKEIVTFQDVIEQVRKYKSVDMADSLLIDWHFTNHIFGKDHEFIIDYLNCDDESFYKIYNIVTDHNKINHTEPRIALKYRWVQAYLQSIEMYRGSAYS